MNTQVLSYVKPFKAILSVDFDGTVHTGEWPNVGLMRTDAGFFIRKLINEGYGVVINTCREGLALATAINWLHNNNVPYHYINCNFPHIIEQYGADCRKISADLYIDDKCLTELPEWDEIYKIINNKYE